VQKRWAGVFTEATHPLVEKFTESISFDWRLFRQDIEGSIAHAEMLAHCHLITQEEKDALIAALQAIREKFEKGEIPFRQELEDIHLHVEQALVEQLGDLGGKLHTARSRNDQVATDLRLWTREAIDQLDRSLVSLQKAFLNRCDRDFEVILPAYTHLRRAQAVLAPHYWLAYCERFQRDRERLADCRRRVNRCPLGAAAIAGTSLPIDRFFVAEKLGFNEVIVNSIDATCDRDFLVEFAFCMGLIALHLSGWAEEWILWSTSEFRFLRLPDAFCTGSSIMPQKRNPDVLELVRGKCGRVLGCVQALMTLLKGLPLGYHRDLQEDKPLVFDAFDTVSACLEVAAAVVPQGELDRQGIEKQLEEGYLDATSLMEYLIRRGIPQRNAHAMVGRLVRRAIDSNRRLAELSLEEFQSESPDIGSDVYGVLGVRNAIAQMRSYGSTAPEEVSKQIQLWKARLGVST